MTTDLTQSTGTGTCTVAVRNFKDDPMSSTVTLHGLFADPAEAQVFIDGLLNEDLQCFLGAEILPLRAATVEAVETSQHLDPSFKAARMAREADQR